MTLFEKCVVFELLNYHSSNKDPYALHKEVPSVEIKLFRLSLPFNI